ncbi:hypothetical protein J6590_000783, partial [Homalodisca vitripennis]
NTSKYIPYIMGQVCAGWTAFLQCARVGSATNQLKRTQAPKELAMSCKEESPNQDQGHAEQRGNRAQRCEEP